MSCKIIRPTKFIVEKDKDDNTFKITGVYDNDKIDSDFCIKINKSNIEAYNALSIINTGLTMIKYN